MEVQHEIFEHGYFVLGDGLLVRFWEDSVVLFGSKFKCKIKANFGRSGARPSPESWAELLPVWIRVPPLYTSYNSLVWDKCRKL